MPDPWATWDAEVKRTGRPSRVVEELTDLELLILLSDVSSRRAVEKQLLRQEAYRRMGHPDAEPPGARPRRQAPRPPEDAQGEARRASYKADAFSEVPERGQRVDPF